MIPTWDPARTPTKHEHEKDYGMGGTVSEKGRGSWLKFQAKADDKKEVMPTGRDTMDRATDRVNDIARGLHKKAHEAGFKLSTHEAQALSVIGLLAAAEVNGKLDAETEAQGRTLVTRILEDGAAKA